MTSGIDNDQAQHIACSPKEVALLEELRRARWEDIIHGRVEVIIVDQAIDQTIKRENFKRRNR